VTKKRVGGSLESPPLPETHTEEKARVLKGGKQENRGDRTNEPSMRKGGGLQWGDCKLTAHAKSHKEDQDDWSEARKGGG